MENTLDPLLVKRRNIAIWDEIAPRYHRRWANRKDGPFGSTRTMLQLLGVEKGQNVLDIACGTGIVTKKISRIVGNGGSVVGTDLSISALKVAKKWCHRRNVTFVQADAEFPVFSKKFDFATCQYALFFFPDAQRVLKNIKGMLKKGGSLGISVHGKKVPFFNSIISVVQKYITDYTPRGIPNVERFSTKSSLHKEVKMAGFSKIKSKKYEFSYSPGKFEDYWKGYLQYIAKPLKEKIDSLSSTQRERIKEEIRNNTMPFTKEDGTITFPWQVIIMTATNCE